MIQSELVGTKVGEFGKINGKLALLPVIPQNGYKRLLGFLFTQEEIPLVKHKTIVSECLFGSGDDWYQLESRMLMYNQKKRQQKESLIWNISWNASHVVMCYICTHAFIEKVKVEHKRTCERHLLLLWFYPEICFLFTLGCWCCNRNVPCAGPWGGLP